MDRRVYGKCKCLILLRCLCGGLGLVQMRFQPKQIFSYGNHTGPSLCIMWTHSWDYRSYFVGCETVRMYGACVIGSSRKDVWIEHEDFVAIVETLRQKLEPNDLEFWWWYHETCMWLCWNVVVHGATFSHPTLLASKASNSLAAFYSANSLQQTWAEEDPLQI